MVDCKSRGITSKGLCWFGKMEFGSHFHREKPSFTVGNWMLAPVQASLAVVYVAGENRRKHVIVEAIDAEKRQ